MQEQLLQESYDVPGRLYYEYCTVYEYVLRIAFKLYQICRKVRTHLRGVVVAILREQQREERDRCARFEQRRVALGPQARIRQRL